MKIELSELIESDQISTLKKEEKQKHNHQIWF